MPLLAISIHPSVMDALPLGATVCDLLDLANQELGGNNTNDYDDNLSYITNALAGITEFFDECQQMECTPQEIIVDAGTYGAVCEDDDPILLTGYPLPVLVATQGVWSGPGITDNGDGTAYFDPSGLVGEITVTYTYTNVEGVATDDKATIMVEICPDAPLEVFCGFTQGFWANPYGEQEGESTEEMLIRLMEIDEDGIVHNPIVVGLSGDELNRPIGQSLTILRPSCIYDLLPGGGNSIPLAPGECVVGIDDCKPCDNRIKRNGKLKNQLATKAISLELNLRYDPNLKDLKLRDFNSLTCVDEIAETVMTALESVHAEPTVEHLLRFANHELAGSTVYNYSDKLRRISEAMSLINNYFQGCQSFDCPEEPVAAVNEIFFDVERVEHTSEINWMLLKEPLGGMYTIEKSANGIHFEPLEEVPAASTDWLARQYTIVDEKPFEGLNHYRLKIQDTLGNLQYTDPRQLYFAQIGMGMLVFPNPATSKVQIYFPNIRKNGAYFKISDALGRIVFDTRLSAGEHQRLNIEFEDYGIYDGVYLISLETSDGTFTEKLVVAGN